MVNTRTNKKVIDIGQNATRNAIYTPNNTNTEVEPTKITEKSLRNHQNDQTNNEINKIEQ